MNIKPRTWFIVSIIFLLISAFGYAALQHSQGGEIGFDARATYRALDDAAQSLAQAEKKGDAAAATALFDLVTPMIRKINDGAKTNAAMNRCQLPAAHLADGVLSVAAGGTWQSKSRFETELSDCK